MFSLVKQKQTANTRANKCKLLNILFFFLNRFINYLSLFEYCGQASGSPIESNTNANPPVGWNNNRGNHFLATRLTTLFLNASSCCICGPNEDRLSTLKPSQVKRVTYGLGPQSLSGVCVCHRCVVEIVCVSVEQLRLWQWIFAIISPHFWDPQQRDWHPWQQLAAITARTVWWEHRVDLL